MTSDQRIEALEMALAHAEAEIADLSQELRRQGVEIAALSRQAGKLTRSLEAMAEGGDEGPAADKPPPHW